MSVLYYGYAALILVGGVLGLVLAGSRVSLLTSALVAVLVTSAARLLPRRPGPALWLGGLCALAVGGFFVSRYAATHKAMPALPVIALSAVVLIASLAALLRKTR